MCFCNVNMVSNIHIHSLLATLAVVPCPNFASSHLSRVSLVLPSLCFCDVSIMSNIHIHSLLAMPAIVPCPNFTSLHLSQVTLVYCLYVFL